MAQYNTQTCDCLDKQIENQYAQIIGCCVVREICWRKKLVGEAFLYVSDNTLRHHTLTYI